MLDHRIMECYANYIHQIFLQKSSDLGVDIYCPSPSDRLRKAWYEQPEMALQVSTFFQLKFLPESFTKSVTDSAKQLESLSQCIDEWPQEKASDFKPMIDAIQNTIRTNYYCSHMKALVIKTIHTSGIFEIFMDHPSFQGVLLKGAMMARGGLRWSDREDFRTECWQLMQTQVLKNTIIVPSGSKGAFLLKNTDITALQAYELFVEGLLDISDNLEHGTVVSPDTVRCYDGPDFYNVVAADKGTASFSDYGNAIALRRGYWLGDAFASGGSNGYNHKKLAITSRGVWVSVRHHLARLGHCPQQPLRVVGIGDMAGDIFGNGMLEESNMQLLAAFNHESIFIDPNPNPDASYRERCRLFHLPQSKWTDYVEFSVGGGVYDRHQETIELSPEACALLGLKSTISTPDVVIRKILQLPVDLLWLGGIGTFVQGECEKGEMDAANTKIRILGKHLRAKIVAEGANLGMTQEGRIEYACAGGTLNTDAIDNCAGVNCSDHEINIKILLDDVLRQGKISSQERSEILQAITTEVCALVLKENAWQNLTLSAIQNCKKDELMQNTLLFLNHCIEKNTVDDIMLKHLYQGLISGKNENRFITRPEMSMVLAYGKKNAKEVLSSIDLSDWGKEEAVRYFPRMLQERFSEFLKDHLLFDAIKTTVLANRLINMLGPVSLVAWSKKFNISFSELMQTLLQWDTEIQGHRFAQKIEGVMHDLPLALELMALYQNIIDAGLLQWAEDMKKRPGKKIILRGASIPVDLWQKYQNALAVVTSIPTRD